MTKFIMEKIGQMALERLGKNVMKEKNWSIWRNFCHDNKEALAIAWGARGIIRHATAEDLKKLRAKDPKLALFCLETAKENKMLFECEVKQDKSPRVTKGINYLAVLDLKGLENVVDMMIVRSGMSSADYGVYGRVHSSSSSHENVSKRTVDPSEKSTHTFQQTFPREAVFEVFNNHYNENKSQDASLIKPDAPWEKLRFVEGVTFNVNPEDKDFRRRLYENHFRFRTEMMEVLGQKGVAYATSKTEEIGRDTFEEKILSTVAYFVELGGACFIADVHNASKSFGVEFLFRLLAQMSAAVCKARELHWNEMFNRLKECQGRFDEIKEADDREFYKWRNTQKRFQSKYKDDPKYKERFDLLNSIGFWEWCRKKDLNGKGEQNMDNDKWNAMFDKLKAFQGQFGDISYKDDRELYNWRGEQKRHRSRYQEDPRYKERFDLLNSIGFWEWCDEQDLVGRGDHHIKDDAWNAMFEKLKVFQGRFGDIKEKKNKKLHTWRNSQRRFQSKYKEEPKYKERWDKLNSIGFWEWCDATTTAH